MREGGGWAEHGRNRGEKKLPLKASEQKFRPWYYKAIVQMQSHPRKSAINRVDFFNCINDTDAYSHSSKRNKTGR